MEEMRAVAAAQSLAAAQKAQEAAAEQAAAAAATAAQKKFQQAAATALTAPVSMTEMRQLLTTSDFVGQGGSMGGAGPVTGPGASHVQFPEEIQEGSGSTALLLAPDASRMVITPLGGGRWAAVLPLKVGPRDPFGQWHRVQQLVNLGLPGGGAVSVTLKPIMQEAPAAKQIPSVETQPAAKVAAQPAPQPAPQLVPDEVVPPPQH